MGIQILPDKRGDLFQRVGRGFGQGLSEQLPKEVERYRLSSGLKDLEQQGGKLSPIQQYASLVQSGANTEQVNQVLPLLERSNANREAREQAQKISSQKQTSVKNQSKKNLEELFGQTNQNTTQEKKGKKPSLVTTGPQKAALNPIRPLTADEIKSQGAELRSQSPNLYKTQEDGEQEAIKRRNSDIAAQQSEINLGTTQRGLRQELENDVAKRLGFDLQKGGFDQFEDVPGHYIKKVIDQVDPEVASGEKTPQEAAETASKDIRDYANLRLANETEGARWMLSKNAEDVKSMLKTQRKGYADRDELKTYVNDLVAYHDLTPARAEYLAYPIERNKKLSSELSKVKPATISDKLGSLFVDTKNQDRPRDFANKLPSLLTTEDSLGAIATVLEGKGLSGGAFLDEVRRLYAEDKIALNPHQKNELDRIGSLDPSIGDWFLFSLGDLGNLRE